jgi:hypothetical protein
LSRHEGFYLHRIDGSSATITGHRERKTRRLKNGFGRAQLNPERRRGAARGMNAVAATFAAGTDEHRQLLARFFLDTHLQYVPEKITWPQLSEADHARLAGLSIWQEAVATENVTSHTVAAAAALESDPDIRRAIELQGFEENRHARLLVALTSHYGIPVTAPQPYVPKSLESDFMSAGFGECFDSFFAFGLFALGKESGYFSSELIGIFEPVVQEEARHILFFVNWVNYRRSQLPLWQRPLFRLRCARIILKKVMARARTARTMRGRSGAGDENFTLTAREEIGVPITLRRLVGLCLEENDRRMAAYDPRLLRPRLVPGIARIIYRMLPARD